MRQGEGHPVTLVTDAGSVQPYILFPPLIFAEAPCAGVTDSALREEAAQDAPERPCLSGSPEPQGPGANGEPLTLLHTAQSLTLQLKPNHLAGTREKSQRPN